VGDTILFEKSDRVAILTIHRPEKMNALSDEVRDDLLAASPGSSRTPPSASW
jgi:enoyl-CoA hydratase/carnithine racemase